jgi:hypothetical protein
MGSIPRDRYIPHRSLGMPCFCRKRCHFVATIGLCVAFAGCGASRSAPRFGEYGVKYVTNGIRTLARGRLPGGAFFVIDAVRYEFGGRTYSVLREHIGKIGQHRITGPGSGSAKVGHGRNGVLELSISSGCAAGHQYALAYGMLRDPQDSVVAQGQGVSIALKKVTVPASFGPYGVMVYSLVSRGQVDVVTRAPSGKIVGDESYGEIRLNDCYGR